MKDEKTIGTQQGLYGELSYSKVYLYKVAGELLYIGRDFFAQTESTEEEQYDVFMENFSKAKKWVDSGKIYNYLDEVEARKVKETFDFLMDATRLSKKQNRKNELRQFVDNLPLEQQESIRQQRADWIVAETIRDRVTVHKKVDYTNL